MMLNSFTKQEQKQIHSIMNVDDNMSENDVIAFALEVASTMCNNIDEPVCFYLTVEDGKLKLEVDS